MIVALHTPEYMLCSGQGDEVARSTRTDRIGGLIRAEFEDQDLAAADALHVLAGGGLRVKLLLHHARALEDQARPGSQRRLNDALRSLETGTPNFELLVHCLDKIVFSDDNPPAGPALRQGGGREQAQDVQAEAPATLSVSMMEAKKHLKKRRLKHSGDFAYLLDTLIYHLRLQQDKPTEELDRFGRSEEEQVGADDDGNADADPDAGQVTPEKQAEILEICHARVRTVVNRMVSQVKAYADGRQPLDQLLLRLLAVLAVLRELRGCDGRVSWVEMGRTTVPKDLRLKLLEEVMFTLFEGQSSLLQLSELGEEFENSDDVARLKGLVLWLAWDCGLTLGRRKPFMETPDQLSARLRQNAMILALAQMMASDGIVIDEARRSIGNLSSGELDWLKEIEALARHCGSLKAHEVDFEQAHLAEPGDIAVHKTLAGWNLRVVQSSGGGRVDLIRLSRESDVTRFTPQHLVVAKMLPSALRSR